MSFKLVAGLGNPGRAYARSRHNVGWLVVDALAQKHGLVWRPDPAFEAEIARWDAPKGTRWLLKPLTFMNDSERAVAAFTRFHRLDLAEIAAVYDDVQLELGRLKVSVGGGAGGHNGVASLVERLGEEFARFRIGIGPREPAELDLKDFVLGKFTLPQRAIIDQKLDFYVQGLELLLDRGADQAMNLLNRKDLP